MQKYKKWEPPLIENKIAKYILTTLAVGVVIVAVWSSPMGLYFLARGAVRSYFRKSDFHRELKRLEKKKFIALTKTKKGWTIRLLQKGQRAKAKYSLEDLKLPRPKAWDGKWRLLSFDIPEESRISRNVLRKKLKNLGMYNFQRSVFAYPYDCRSELEFLTDYYRVSKYVSYIEASYVDISSELRTYFSL